MASRYESSASDSWPCADCPDVAFLVVIATGETICLEDAFERYSGTWSSVTATLNRYTFDMYN